MTNYWFVLIERSIEDQRDRSQGTEFGNQLMVKRVGLAVDGLQTA